MTMTMTPEDRAARIEQLDNEIAKLSAERAELRHAGRVNNMRGRTGRLRLSLTVVSEDCEPEIYVMPFVQFDGGALVVDDLPSAWYRTGEGALGFGGAGWVPQEDGVPLLDWVELLVEQLRSELELGPVRFDPCEIKKFEETLRAMATQLETINEVKEDR